MIVDQAETLGEAKQKLDEGSFDVVLLDLNLIDSRGIDTIEALIEYNLPIVVLTGDITESHMSDALNLGVLDYIKKTSIYKANLPAKLETAISKHKKAKENGGKRFAFSNLDLIKPYLTSSAVCGSRPPFSVA